MTDVDALEAEITRLTQQVRRCEESNHDWPRGSTVEAVDRLRAASESDDSVITINPADLRKLFSSADGVANSYSTVISEITMGMLSKPSTDPRYVLDRARELENERFDEDLKEATEELQEQVRLAGELADAAGDVIEWVKKEHGQGHQFPRLEHAIDAFRAAQPDTDKFRAKIIDARCDG